jgi:hypothetical protein
MPVLAEVALRNPRRVILIMNDLPYAQYLSTRVSPIVSNYGWKKTNPEAAVAVPFRILVY